MNPTEEREMLERDLANLENAESVEVAAGGVLDFMDGTKEPLHDEDNVWKQPLPSSRCFCL